MDRDCAPAAVGAKALTWIRLQLEPLLKIWLAAHAPLLAGATVNSLVAPLTEYGVASSTMSPPVARTVTVPEHPVEDPIPALPHETEDTEADPAAAPVPDRAAAVVVPFSTLDDNTAVRVPDPPAVKVIAPSAQLWLSVRFALAQAPAAIEKSVAFVPENAAGVAFRTTGPLVAVILADPVQTVAMPTVALQVTPATLIVAKPYVPVAESVALPAEPLAGVTVIVSLRAPAAVGVNVTAARLHEAPALNV